MNSFVPRRELPNMVAHRPILICPATSSRCSRKDDQTDHPDSTKARNPPHDFILEPEAALVAPSPPNRRTCQPALVAARTRYAPAWSESANPSRGGYLGPRLGRHDQPLSARPTDPVKRRVHRCAMKCDLVENAQKPSRNTPKPRLLSLFGLKIIRFEESFRRAFETSTHDAGNRKSPPDLTASI